MYRLLVVDDEDFIVDGLIDLFEDQLAGEWEYYPAYSAHEALESLSRTRIDIVLTDIHMPGITGLELQERISQLWPHCKVIFLTGYNDFNYIQSAMRNQSVDYILKTESDEVIIKAVEKAVFELQHRFQTEQLVEQAKQQLQAALPILQKELVWDILNGVVSLESASQQFEALQLELGLDQPVLLLLGRIDGWSNTLSRSDRMLLVYALQNITGEFLAPYARYFSIVHDQGKLVWLIQFHNGFCGDGIGSASSLDGRLYQLLNGIMENIQAACKRYLQLKVSLLSASEPVEWSGCAVKYSELAMLFHVHYGMQYEVLLTESKVAEKIEQVPIRERGIYDLRSNTWALLQACLEKGDKQQFQEIFRGLVQLVPANQLCPDVLWLHIYHSLLSIYVSHLHQSGMSGEAEGLSGYEQVIATGGNGSWGELAERLWQMAEAIFARQLTALADREREVIRKIKQYISLNLGADLSLSRISDEVGYNPSYLSRLYKQMTGEGLSDYILAQRLLLAKELLSKRHMRIHDIAEALGFDSPAYFARFFKKQTGTTPTEYRERT